MFHNIISQNLAAKNSSHLNYGYKFCGSGVWLGRSESGFFFALNFQDLSWDDSETSSGLGTGLQSSQPKGWEAMEVSSLISLAPSLEWFEYKIFCIECLYVNVWLFVTHWWLSVFELPKCPRHNVEATSLYLT